MGYKICKLVAYSGNCSIYNLCKVCKIYTNLKLTESIFLENNSQSINTRRVMPNHLFGGNLLSEGTKLEI